MRFQVGNFKNRKFQIMNFKWLISSNKFQIGNFKKWDLKKLISSWGS